MPKLQSFPRRHLLAGGASLAGLALSGCTATGELRDPAVLHTSENWAQIYGPIPQEQFPVPAVDLSKVDEKYYRRQIKYQTDEPVGSVIVDTAKFYLYFVQPDDLAMRYGVGLGKAGFEWSGRARIAWKRKWPKWTPPKAMIEREPELEKYSVSNGGMPPGLENPLGARALYIFEGKVDTLYRLHGTQEFDSIGNAVSSGCVRLLNQDIIDLYDRVPSGAPIRVL